MHALPLAVNIADSVILSILRNVSSVIETYVQAFPNLEEIFTFDAAAFNSAMLLGLSLSIIPGGFTIAIVLNKEVILSSRGSCSDEGESGVEVVIALPYRRISNLRASSNWDFTSGAMGYTPPENFEI